MSKHTSEPWKINERNSQQIVAPSMPKRFWGNNDEYSGDFIVTQTGLYTTPHDEEVRANADRIVACVNALKGFSTPDLEAGIVGEMVELLGRIKGAKYKTFDNEIETLLSKIKGSD